MHDQHSADSIQKSVHGQPSDEPATVDATGPYVSLTPTKPEPKSPEPLPNAPTIPGYVITGIIAKGGMGVVYSALDLKFNREVAIKILLPGGDAERFVTEAKITARLPHPAIPPVHDLGELGDGAKGGRWLAMKLIRGQTLHTLLPSPARGRGAGGEGELDRPRLIQIFEQIAQAVGFAHSRGIIHRDLKPLNVMVGEFGEVQVMDWGLAKDVRGPSSIAHRGEQSQATGDGQWTTDDGQHTAFGAIMGTPGYMAPEQARGEVVDARADVFALGSILTALLTGKPAFVAATVSKLIQKTATADLADAMSRLDACGADAEVIALCKHCLSAQAEERPENGQAVANEVAAYRAGVEARLRQAEMDRARAETQAAEQAKRRQQLLVAASAVAAVLVVGILGTAWGLVEANKAAAKEKGAKEQTVRQLTQIEKGVELFAGMVAGIDPRDEELGGPTVYEQLRQKAENAADQLDAQSVGDALVVARLQTILGDSLLGLGNAPKATEVLEYARKTRERELGHNHPDTLTTLAKLAAAYQDAGKLTQAVRLFERVQATREQVLGPDHPDTLNTRNDLALAYQDAGRLTEAIALFRQVRTAREQILGPDDRETLASCNNLALAYYAAGNFLEAIKLLEHVRGPLVKERGADHPACLTLLGNLAAAYQAAGNLPEAITLFEQVRAAQTKKLGADHPSTLITLHNLAEAYRAAGRLSEAITLFEQVCTARERELGGDHPSTLNSLNGLAAAYYAAGKFPEALTLFEQVRAAQELSLGADHPKTLTTLGNLAAAYQRAKRLPEAITLFEQVRAAQELSLGADHPSTLTTTHNLAEAFRTAKRLPESIALFEQARDGFVNQLGGDHPTTLMTRLNLAVTYRDAGRHAEAIMQMEQVRAGQEKVLGTDHPDTLLTLRNLAFSYRASGKLLEAIALLEQVRRAEVKTLGADHPDTIRTLGNLGKGYIEAGQAEKGALFMKEFVAAQRKQFPKDSPQLAGSLAQISSTLLKCDQFPIAEEMLRECLAIREKKEPDAWTTFNTMSLLGGALLGQEKFAEAEPLLVKGYEGMKARLDTTPAANADRLGLQQRIPEALDRLIELYTATNKPDEAAKYRSAKADWWREQLAGDPVRLTLWGWPRF